MVNKWFWDNAIINPLVVTHSTKAWILIKYPYALCRETSGWSSVWYMGPTVWITWETGSLKPLSNISEHETLSTNGSLTGFGKYWQHRIKRTQKNLRSNPCFSCRTTNTGPDLRDIPTCRSKFWTSSSVYCWDKHCGP